MIDPRRDAVLFAGGTGVTAFTAFLQSLTPDHATRVLLFYGARTADLFVYGALVEGVRQAGPVADVQPRLRGDAGSALGRRRVAGDPPLPRSGVLPERPAGDARARSPRSYGEHGVGIERIRTDAWE